MSQFALQVVGDGPSSALMEALRRADFPHFDDDEFYGAPGSAAPHADDDNEPASLALSVLNEPLAFIAGVAFAVLCGVGAMIEPPTGWSMHAPMQHALAFAGQGLEVLRTQVAAAEPHRWPAVSKPAAAPAAIAVAEPTSTAVERIYPPAMAAAPAPRLSAAIAVEGPLATMLRLPLEITNAERLDRDSVLLVTNVPDYAGLSQGQPLGAGTWVVPASKATDLGIIAYAQPSSKPRLAFELLSGEGALISRANAVLTIGDPERADRLPTNVTSAPGSTRLARLAESTVHRR